MRFPGVSNEQVASLTAALTAQAAGSRSPAPDNNQIYCEQLTAPQSRRTFDAPPPQFYDLVPNFKVEPEFDTGMSSLQQPNACRLENSTNVVAPSPQSFTNGTATAGMTFAESNGQPGTLWAHLAPKGYDDASSCRFADDRGISCDPNSLELYFPTPECFTVASRDSADAARNPPNVAMSSNNLSAPARHDSVCTQNASDPKQSVQELSAFLFGPVPSRSSQQQCNPPDASTSPQCSLASEQSLEYLQTTSRYCMPGQAAGPTCWPDSWQQGPSMSEQTEFSHSVQYVNSQQRDINCNPNSGKTCCNIATLNQDPGAVKSSFPSNPTDQKQAPLSSSCWTADMSLSLDYWNIREALNDPIVLKAAASEPQPSCSVAESDVFHEQSHSGVRPATSHAGPAETDVACPAAPYPGPEGDASRPAVSCSITREPRQSSSGDHVPVEGHAEDHSRTREQQLQRYRDKKVRRLLQPAVRYKLRKANADQRPRIKGRFVKKHEEAAARQAAREKLLAVPAPP